MFFIYAAGATAMCVFINIYVCMFFVIYRAGWAISKRKWRFKGSESIHEREVRFDKTFFGQVSHYHNGAFHHQLSSSEKPISQNDMLIDKMGKLVLQTSANCVAGS